MFGSNDYVHVEWSGRIARLLHHRPARWHGARGCEGEGLRLYLPVHRRQRATYGTRRRTATARMDSVGKFPLFLTLSPLRLSPWPRTTPLLAGYTATKRTLSIN